MKVNKRSNYNETVPVIWRDVLRCLGWALNVRRHEAERWIDEVESDVIHNYPDCLNHDMFCALDSCEKVFYQFEMLNTLRKFLRYNPKTVSKTGLERFYSFYAKYKMESPSSDSLAASTTEGHRNNE